MSAEPATAAPLSISERRSVVRQLSDQRLSARAIAAKLGVGKDTVRRDLEALRQDPPPPAPTGAPVACADQVTVAYDDKLRADLAVLAEAGLSPEGAIRFAVGIVSYSYRAAWERGICPRGVAPLIRTTTARPGSQKEATA
ncbi:HTH domain-containing protein [Streptomyces sp. NPDC051320]|uniref:HTH domain-containing protein n=1 Tax=Streptomyces sp. NPDC051320 TaxID=3154644 RepID=UPI0034320AD4